MDKIQLSDIDKLFFHFTNPFDLEVIATIIALFNDGYSYHLERVNHVVFDIMGGKPYEYVMGFKMKDTKDINDDFEYKHLGGFITMWNLQHLVYHLASVYMNYGTLCIGIKSILSQQKIRYAHEALIKLFGNNAGFQSKKGNGTFFRLNFLLCLLSLKFNLLELEEEEANKCLLPCDDDVFDYMLKHHVISSSDAVLPNVIKITTMAKKEYQCDTTDFFMMYYKCKKQKNGLQ